MPHPLLPNTLSIPQETDAKNPVPKTFCTHSGPAEAPGPVQKVSTHSIPTSVQNSMGVGQKGHLTDRRLRPGSEMTGHAGLRPPDYPSSLTIHTPMTSEASLESVLC